VAALDAGASALTMVASQPKCAAARSPGTARTGIPSRVPMTSAMSRSCTACSPTPCRTDPAGAFSAARTRWLIGSGMLGAGRGPGLPLV
jgi:hypothetical protein